MAGSTIPRPAWYACSGAISLDGARALVNNPQLILADEPTGELDSTTAREILGLFRRIVDEEHVTLVMVSHDALVDEYTDEVVQLQDGQIIRQISRSLSHEQF